MADFIEYPRLVDRIPASCRDQKEDFPSDITILVEEKGSSNCMTFPAHLRILSQSSDVFYFLPLTQTLPSNHLKKTFTSGKKSPCDGENAGDITLRTPDGSCLRMGSLSQPLSTLKAEIQDMLGIPIFEQHLFRTSQSQDNKPIEDDWRSLAGCGLRRDDTLLLMQETWQRYEASSKTLTLRLPKICARRARIHICKFTQIL